MNEKNPWLPLISYDENSKDSFYGRETEIREFYELIDDSLLSTLYGKSGIGKSSLLKAGIFPRLRMNNYYPVYVRLGNYIKAEKTYSSCIIEALENSDTLIKQHNVELASVRNSLWDYFHSTVFKIIDSGEEVYPVIVMDQFEEILINNVNNKAEEFITSLYSLLSNNKRIDNNENYQTDTNFRFIISLREDCLYLLEDIIENKGFSILRENRYRLRAFDKTRAQKVVKNVGKEFIEGDEDKVSEALVDYIISYNSKNNSENRDIEPLILSLLCYMIFDNYPKLREEYITNLRSSNPLIDYYNKAVLNFSGKEKRFIEEQMISIDGRRVSVSKENFENNIKHIDNSKYPIFIKNSNNYEIAHDLMAKAIFKIKEEKKEREKRKRNNKMYLSIISFIVILGSVFGFLGSIYYIENEKLYEEYYAEFENRNGWPVGIGQPLSKDERLRTALYYKLSHKGNKNKDKHTDVEIMSSTKFLPNSCRLQKLEWSEEDNYDSKAKAYNEILKNVTSVKYSSTVGGDKIGKEELMDKNGNLLMTISYFHISANEAWAQFYTPKGKNMKIRDNGLDRVKLLWDSIGRIKYLMYYDAQGLSKEIIHGKDVNGYAWEYIDNKVYRYALNKHGLLTDSLKNNTILISKKDGVVEEQYLKSRKVGDKSGKEVTCNDGYSRAIHRNDSIYFFLPGSTRPNATRYLKKNSLGQIFHISTEVVKGTETEAKFASNIYYDYENGLLKKEEFWDKDGKPYGENDKTIYKREFTYNEVGDVVKEVRYNKGNEIAYFYAIEIKCENKDTIKTIRTIDITKTPNYIEQIDSIKLTYRSTTYTSQGEKLNKRISVGNDSLCVHKIITKEDVTKRNKIITNEYYFWDDKENKIDSLPKKVDKLSGKAISYFRRIEEYDNDGNITSLKLEDDKGKTIKSMMYFIQNGQQIGRAVKGIDGNPVRCDEWEEEGLLYYKLYYSRDFENNYSALTAVNEWEQRSSIYNGSIYVSEAYVSLKDNFVHVFDNKKDNKPIYKEKIEICNTYEQLVFAPKDPELSLDEIPYIHVLSKNSKMYNNGNGVIDGDRIIAFENWKWKSGNSMKLFEDKWKNTVGKKDSLTLTVLRPDVNSDKYIKKELKLKSDKEENNTAKNNYIHYHILRMTNSEKDFLEKELDRLQKEPVK